ncbi:MAG: O-antigen polymerase [bacterium]
MLHQSIQLTLFFLCIPILYLAFKSTGYSIRKISIPTIFFLFFILQVYLAFPFFFTGLHLYSALNEQSILYQMFLSSVLGFSCIFIGIAIANFKKKHREIIVENSFHGLQYCTAVILFLICIVVLILYFKTLAEVPFFALLRGARGIELNSLRSDSASSYKGKVYYYTMFIHGLLPFLSYYFFATHLFTKKKFTKIIFTISFFASVIALISTLHKAPIVYYFLFLIMLWALVRQKKINWKIAFMTLGSGFGFILLLYAVIRSVTINVTEVFYVILNRAFLGQIRDSYYYIKMFPEKVDFLLGQSMGIPSIISPFDSHYPLSVNVMNFIYPGVYGEIVGRANTVYWGEIYANFGFIAIPIISLFVGIYIGIIQRILEKKITALNVAVLVFFIDFFLVLVCAGISRISPLNSQFMLVVLAAALLYLLRNINPLRYLRS